LFRTNVEGLRYVLEAAADADLRRFVYTSTIGTIALSEHGRPVTEDEPFNWADKGGGYIRSRVKAEQLVFQYVRERGLPAVPQSRSASRIPTAPVTSSRRRTAHCWPPRRRARCRCTSRAYRWKSSGSKTPHER
jgi:hypothetical protein